jgi:Carboxypeptidase regulatory-like domain
VVARGFMPTYTPEHIVPEKGEATIALKPHDLDGRKPERVLRGRVVNENGDPVPRAMVEPDGVQRGQGGRFGALDEMGIDVLAVTDDAGEFRLGVGEDGDALYLMIKAPFLANERTKPLAAGPMTHTIRLGVGVTVSGRVVKNGQPLPDVGMGIVQVDRNVIGYLGHFEFGTDRASRFAFANIPPNQTWYFYGLMDSLKAHGSIPIRTVKTEGHGSTLELGDIEVQPGYRLSGRLVLSDGKPAPAETRVLVGRETAWDTQTVTVDADGRFSFTGLPPEQLDLSTRIRGYHPSEKNASLDMLNRSGLVGTIGADIDGLRFLLEPGPDPEIDYHKFSREDHAENQRRRNSSLRGAAGDK